MNTAGEQIEAFLPAALGVQLNPTKTVLQPIARGIDFVGQVIKPWRRTLRRRTYNNALHRLQRIDDADLYETANSYFGLLRQATHSRHDRARIARLLLRRGFVVNCDMTKTFRRRIA